MFRSIVINTKKNILLCDTELVGIGELVELFSLGENRDTPPQIMGKILKKVSDPNLFEVYEAYDSQDYVGKRYLVEADCIFRILMKTMGGTRRRKFSEAEKHITNVEHDNSYQEKKVIKAKTGSVRKNNISTNKSKSKSKSRRRK
jgi:hypothetical protein